MQNGFCALYPNNRLFVYDLNKTKQTLFSIDCVVRNKNGMIETRTEELKSIVRMVFLYENDRITFDPSANKPFEIRGSNQRFSFGEYAVKGEIQNSKPQNNLLILFTIVR